MEQNLESRIALDEADWAVRFSALQLANSQGVEAWHSRDGLYAYHAIADSDPFEGIPSYDMAHDMPATIPDPEFISDTFDPINPSRWSIIRTLSANLKRSIEENRQMRREVGAKNKRPSPLSSTVFNIDEKARQIRVMDMPDGMFGDSVLRMTPSFRDIAELCDALDDLAIVLNH